MRGCIRKIGNGWLITIEEGYEVKIELYYQKWEEAVAAIRRDLESVAMEEGE